MTEKRRIASAAAAGAAGLLLLILLVGAAVMYGGVYNVAASIGHTPFARWILDTTVTNSVQSRASDIAAPEFTPAMVAAGAGEYKSMCQHCHGGPGVQRESWAEGIVPRPPGLSKAAEEWQPREIFWIVKHGIKMTGMPAFGPSHDDRTVWNIAAFVDALPEMEPSEYAAYPAGHGGAPRTSGENGASHQH